MSGYLGDPTIGLSPQAKKLHAKEAEAKKILKEQKRLEAEKRKIERALFQKCDHLFEDVTEERRTLIEKRGLPSWVNKRKLALKYGKCTGCGLLKISDVETVVG